MRNIFILSILPWVGISYSFSQLDNTSLYFTPENHAGLDIKELTVSTTTKGSSKTINYEFYTNGLLKEVTFKTNKAIDSIHVYSHYKMEYVYESDSTETYVDGPFGKGGGMNKRRVQNGFVLCNDGAGNNKTNKDRNVLVKYITQYHDEKTWMSQESRLMTETIQSANCLDSTHFIYAKNGIVLPNYIRIMSCTEYSPIKVEYKVTEAGIGSKKELKTVTKKGDGFFIQEYLQQRYTLDSTNNVQTIVQEKHTFLKENKLVDWYHPYFNFPHKKKTYVSRFSYENSFLKTATHIYWNGILYDKLEVLDPGTNWKQAILHKGDIEINVKRSW